MAELQKIHAVLVPVEVSMETIKIKFKVSPSVTSTEEFQRELNRRSTEIADQMRDDSTRMRVDYGDFEYALANAVKQWDITDDGKPLDITEDTVKMLPVPLKIAMWNEVLDALDPKNLIRRTQRTSSQRGG